MWLVRASPTGKAHQAAFWAGAAGRGSLHRGRLPHRPSWGQKPPTRPQDHHQRVGLIGLLCSSQNIWTPFGQFLGETRMYRDRSARHRGQRRSGKDRSCGSAASPTPPSLTPTSATVRISRISAHTPRAEEAPRPSFCPRAASLAGTQRPGFSPSPRSRFCWKILSVGTGGGPRAPAGSPVHQPPPRPPCFLLPHTPPSVRRLWAPTQT